MITEIIEAFVYIVVFVIAVFMASLYQRMFNRVQIIGVPKGFKFIRTASYCVVGCLFVLPVIAMCGLRYGIGFDYFAYEQTFNMLHLMSFKDYWIKYTHNIVRIEPAYYVLNRLMPSYRILLWCLAILMFTLIFLAVKDYSDKLSIPFALYIFLSTQFIYSLNGIRFVIAACFLLLGYKSVSQNQTLKFVIFVFAASLFHTSALFCLSIVFLKKFKHRRIDSIRNVGFYVFILLFPIICRYLLRIAGTLPVFEKYFSVSEYLPNEAMSSSWKWLLRIFAVLLPLILFCRKEIAAQEETKTFLKICILEIPFGVLGMYNVWYGRFGRNAKIAQVIFVPLILNKITNKHKKIIMYIYYIIWYTFDCIYYAVVNDAGTSLPYVWIFSQ